MEDTAYFEVEDGKRRTVLQFGPTFAIGVYIQTINSSRNNVLEYTTHQTIIMIPFVSLLIQRFSKPK